MGSIPYLIFEKGKSITKQQAKNGNIPVVAGGCDYAYFHNKANRNANVITISASGANSGFVNFWQKPIWASDCSTIVSVDENNIKICYIYEYLKSIQAQIYELQKGNAQPHVYIDDLKTVKIPLPPLDVQQKIVDEIEEIEKNKLQINKLYEQLYLKANKRIRLSNNDVFELGIGKRVLNSEVSAGGKYPVYSANVFEPFGYTNKLLINDFTKAYVIWGIDGDWMVNILPENMRFYPTDHCGFIRLKDHVLEEKYLAYALEQEGKIEGFSRQKRASIARILGISIPLPNIEDQRNVVIKTKELEHQIAEAQAAIGNSKQLKQEILDKYLK